MKKDYLTISTVYLFNTYLFSYLMSRIILDTFHKLMILLFLQNDTEYEKIAVFNPYF